MRRIERLINLIAALLDTERPMSAEDIRQKIAGYDQPNHDAFRRSFERDKEALRTMGIPLEVRPVPGADVDGYIIPKDKYYLPELDLEPDELAALRLTASAVLGGQRVAESGLMKLSVDAPNTEWNGPRVVWGADMATEQPLLGSLYGALLDRAAVSFDYSTAEGSTSVRYVEPYGLVHRTGNWYVVGRDVSRDAVRSFKVSRIAGDVRPTGESYTIPESFDAASHLGGEPWEIGEETTDVTVHFDASLAWWADQNLAGLPTTTDADGGRTVTMKVARLDALISWVIGLGEHVEIVAPAEARARLVQHLSPFLESA
ncbi:MAG: WYL domain-containing protein [Actinobacteria bacterium]|nr:WYL domain-containing protein [Actinomycetota bacterium]